MMEVEIRELQMKLLEMFKWFHTFCTENNLRYYMICGTLLGAVRHNGFIPWDDDIDVGMPRADYIKLQELMRNYNGRYIFESMENGQPDFFYPFGKIYDTTTMLQENTKYRIKRGVFLDVFPLDGLGNTYEEAVERFYKIDRKRKFLLARTTRIRKGRKWYKNLSVILSQIIPPFIIDDKKILNEIEQTAREKSFAECCWVANLFGAWGKKEITAKHVLGNPTLYKFEDFSAYGVEKADEYLSRVYGDWRKLPPKEKRISHHDFLAFDLNKSYLE